MTSVGEILRTERESQGREIAEIAEELCITQRYLRAIEQDDLKSLPGIFFYKSFVRQYARFLLLDEKSVLPAMEALTAGAEPLPLPGADVRYPVRERGSNNDNDFFFDTDLPAVRTIDPIVEAGNRRYFGDRRIGLSVMGLAIVLFGCSGFYAWWNQAPQLTRPVEPVQASSAPASPAVESPATPNQTAPASIAAAAPETGGNAPTEEVSSQPSGAAPVVNVTSTTDSDGTNHVVLSLSATEETWLSITSDGKQIFSGILRPSQTKTLTGLEVARMKVGNAGGLEVRWNGKPIGPIGPRGQVRVILFTPDNFQILEPSQTL